MAVRPVLFNLFAEPAIIRVPTILRGPLAVLISWARQKSAKANYALMGGGSPLLPQTEAQAEALRIRLAEQMPDADIRCFTAMRYWAPLAKATVRAVAGFSPGRDRADAALSAIFDHHHRLLDRPVAGALPRSGTDPVDLLLSDPAGLIEAHAARIEAAWDQAGRPPGVRLLFSAHGLPEQVIARGDPYQSQIEATAAAIAQRLGPDWSDWRICYQSRVGPMKWLGPTTMEMIEAAVEDGLGVVIAPIAFVSEHVETLVELDHDYAAKAAALGCAPYIRAPALGLDENFIDGLAGLVTGALSKADRRRPRIGLRLRG